MIDNISRNRLCPLFTPHSGIIFENGNTIIIGKSGPKQKAMSLSTRESFSYILQRRFTSIWIDPNLWNLRWRSILKEIQSRTLNFATSAGAMNRFAPTKVAKFKVRDCTTISFNTPASVHLTMTHINGHGSPRGLHNIYIIQSRTLNLATFVGANLFIAPAEIAKFNVRDCIIG